MGCGGVGTHWQPLNTFSRRKCEPSLGSGEEMRARWGAVVRARGGVGTHWPRKCERGNAGQGGVGGGGGEGAGGWGVGGGGCEGAGGCGHALAAFKYFLT